MGPGAGRRVVATLKSQRTPVGSMRTSILTLTILVTAFAGCLGGDDEGDGTTTTTTTSGTQTSTSTSTQGPPDETVRTELFFLADPTTGNASLDVDFTAAVRDNVTSVDGAAFDVPHEGNFTYSLTWGDGQTSETGNHTSFPLATNHTYTVANNYTATLTVTLANGTLLTQSVDITVSLGGDPGEPQEPPQLLWEFGPSAGCAGDVLQIAGANCITALLGPGATGPDGFWIPLDERFWGLMMTSESSLPNALGDTDGFFVDADGAVMSADINNSSGPAEGTVPGGAAWLFVYNYGLPSQSLTVTFA